jgi:hypothetical protein
VFGDGGGRPAIDAVLFELGDKLYAYKAFQFISYVSYFSKIKK